MILAVVFGSFIAITPLIIAAAAIPTVFAVHLRPDLRHHDVHPGAEHRRPGRPGRGHRLRAAHRDPLARGTGHGLANRAAVLRASATAGRSVLFSGLTVTVSLAALALTTVPFLRSIGLAGLLIPLVSIAVSATLLPVILDRSAPGWNGRAASPPARSARCGPASPQAVVAHRGWSAAGALAILAVLIVPVFSLNLGEPQATATAAHRPGRRPRRPGRPDLIRHRARVSCGPPSPAARGTAPRRGPGIRSLWSHPPPGPATGLQSPTPGQQPTHRPATARPR